jgi:hypothetical protein
MGRLSNSAFKTGPFSFIQFQTRILSSPRIIFCACCCVPCIRAVGQIVPDVIITVDGEALKPRCSARLLGRAWNPGVSLWRAGIFALIADGLGLQFPPEGVIFRRARPRRRILRKTAGPFRHVIKHGAGAGCEGGHGNYQCNQANHLTEPKYALRQDQSPASSCIYGAEQAALKTLL